LKPGKRMRTAISPMIVLKNGKPFAALGTSGAARIISTTAILASNLLDHKMGIQEAIESPRYFARDAPNELQVEKGIPHDTLDTLERLGYSLKQREDYDPFFGGTQGIVINPDNCKRMGGLIPAGTVRSPDTEASVRQRKKARFIASNTGYPNDN